MEAKIIADIEDEYPDFLRDESRLTGCADSISFPATEEDIVGILASMSQTGTPVTVQGARTGVTGGSVPDGGHILNLGRMNRILAMGHTCGNPDAFTVTVQPGLVLSELRTALESKNFDTADWSGQSITVLDELKKKGPHFFPPDPTEASAAIGGMVGANASGACTFHYGATRSYIHRLRVVTADGDVIDLSRDTSCATGHSFSIATVAGRTVRGSLPSYDMPGVKSAAGYFSRPNMDLVDLFIGSEGTLGVFSEIELVLSPSPADRWGVVAFFPSEAKALDFVIALRESASRPVAIELFGEHALNLLRGRDGESVACDFPSIPGDYSTAIYVEYHGNDEETLGENLLAMSETMVDCGGSEEATWIADSPQEMERLKGFRHAIPESVNMLIDRRRKSEPGITKLGTDMAVPDSKLRDVMTMYRADLEKACLEHVIFGHVGNNHLHVNILPQTMADYDSGKCLYAEWARQVVAMGGTVSAEHGVGKLKRHFLEIMYGETGVSEMRALKRAFDPQFILNRGNLFE